MDQGVTPRKEPFTRRKGILLELPSILYNDVVTRRMGGTHTHKSSTQQKEASTGGNEKFAKF